MGLAPLRLAEHTTLVLVSLIQELPSIQDRPQTVVPSTTIIIELVGPLKQVMDVVLTSVMPTALTAVNLYANRPVIISFMKGSQRTSTVPSTATLNTGDTRPSIQTVPKPYDDRLIKHRLRHKTLRATF